MRLTNGKIYITQRSMNRMFHGTHQPWQALRNEGMQVLVAPPAGFDVGIAVALPDGQHPSGPVLGFRVEGVDYLVAGKPKFIANIPLAGQKRRIKEMKLGNMPPIVVDFDGMENMAR